MCIRLAVAYEKENRRLKKIQLKYKKNCANLQPLILSKIPVDATNTDIYIAAEYNSYSSYLSSESYFIAPCIPLGHKLISVIVGN